MVLCLWSTEVGEFLNANGWRWLCATTFIYWNTDKSTSGTFAFERPPFLLVKYLVVAASLASRPPSHSHRRSRRRMFSRTDASVFRWRTTIETSENFSIGLLRNYVFPIFRSANYITEENWLEFNCGVGFAVYPLVEVSVLFSLRLLFFCELFILFYQ